MLLHYLRIYWDEKKKKPLLFAVSFMLPFLTCMYKVKVVSQ